MTEVTMSPGSKPKVAILACRLRLRRGTSRPSPAAAPATGPTRSGRTLRSRSRNSSSLMPLSLVQGDAQLAVVGPAHEQHHVVDAEVRGHLADEAHRDLDVLGFGLVLDLLQALHAPSAGSARSSSRAAAGSAARTGPNRSAGTTRCRPASPAPPGSGHSRQIGRHHQPAQADEPGHQPCRNP